MNQVVCPACQQALPDTPLPAHCPHCGHDLVALPPREGWRFDRIDLRKAARHQRRLLRLVLGLFVILILTPGISLVQARGVVQLWAVIGIAFCVVVYVHAIGLLTTLGTRIIVLILFAVVLLIPGINIVVLVMIDQVATRMLRGAGLPVGLMGVSDEQVVRHLGMYRCHVCGYNLIGNVSGRCPECGALTGRSGPPTTPA